MLSFYTENALTPNKMLDFIEYYLIIRIGYQKQIKK